MSGALQAVLRQVAPGIVYVRHVVHRICSARVLLLDQPCKLVFGEQEKTAVTTALPKYRLGYNLITSHELSLKVQVIKTDSHSRAYILAIHLQLHSSFKISVLSSPLLVCSWSLLCVSPPSATSSTVAYVSYLILWS